ncbi:hypothetical protein [Kitasatospora sp. NPDC097691]|uniref:hypothetical protein n=1 Tax=Kitasatospora sp. NPDC097691 TaxID=3157231 RepID=UPI00331DE460
MSELLWVAVPGGLTPPDQALLRLLIIPRLDAGTTLTANGLAHWPPQSLTAPGTTLRIDTAAAPGGPVAAHPTAPRSQVQGGVWEAFFRPDAGVRPAVPIPQREVSVRPTAAEKRRILATYQTSAMVLRSADSLPAFHNTVRSELAKYQDDETPPAPAANAPAGTGPDAGPPDVHRVLALLREHPAVLRAMGLILELPVPVADLPDTDEGVIRVGWDTPPAGLPPIASPWSAYTRATFLPTGADGADLTDGMLALGRPHWDLTTIDTVSALGRLRDAAATEAASARAAAAAGPAPDGEQNGEPDPAAVRPETGDHAPTLPALRTAGILLIRDGHEEQLKDRQREGNTQVGRPGIELPVLTAEHLLLGYRFDVRVFGETWHSLNRRLATYSVGGQTVARRTPEEGHVKARSGIDHGDGVLRTDEVLARWDGWSLTAPRPTFDGRVTGDPTGATNTLPFDFGWTMEPEPGTLLKLRFGKLYQIRARVADIAGGGRPPESPSPDGSDSDTVLFGRHEPIGSPTVTLPDGVEAGALGPGATTFVMVVRAEEDEASRPSADAVRSLLPPPAAFETVERHGMFDLAGPDDTFGLVLRETLPDPAAAGAAVFLRPEPGGPPADLEPKGWQGAWPDLASKRIVLHVRRPGEPTVDWTTDDDLTVALGPAQQVTLELSSFLDSTTLGSFALNAWLPRNLGGDHPDVLEDALSAVVSGRNPMITPARTLTLLHTVKRPLATPAGTLKSQRTEGQTFSDLVPTPDPPGAQTASTGPLGVHTASTGTLTVTGSWAEVDDSGTHPASGHVTTVPVGRGDTELPTLRHEFGDTKHRQVTYTLTATSRFRPYYGSGAPEDFQTTSAPTPEIDVPSSARPAAPQVLSVVPAFTWATAQNGATITHRRLGNRLRVELARPWFLTGAEEALALLVSQGEPTENLLPYVTLFGRDPIWDTVIPPHSPALDGLHVALAEIDLKVLAVPHPVWSHGDSWYADLALPATTSYSPLIRPVVARLQTHSLPDLELSPVVRTDFVPLLPDRTLTVERMSGDWIRVTLDGIGPNGPEPNIVRVAVEHPADGGADVDGVAAHQVGPGSIGWVGVGRGRTKLGDSVLVEASAPGPLRVRVRELEQIPSGTPSDQPEKVLTEPSTELSDRVVFTDVVPLP